MESVQEENKKSVQEENRKPVCLLNSDGITLFGYQFSWLTIILVCAVLLFLVKEHGMFGDQVSAVFNSPTPSVGISSQRLNVPTTYPTMDNEVSRLMRHF